MQSSCTSQFGMRAIMFLLMAVILSGGLAKGGEEKPGLLSSEFIFEKAPFPSCHASTLAESRAGLVAAWFGGTAEKNPDVGIWVACLREGKWSSPCEVANGVQPDGSRFPCWNPVLFQSGEGPLLLFYKVGPDPKSWWGMVMSSPDGGNTWSQPRRLPEGILGLIKNKPVELSDGRVLCPTSTETKAGPLREWRIQFENTDALTEHWESTPPVDPGDGIQAIQPSILLHEGGVLQALGRTRQKRIFQTWSRDGGKSWEPLRLTDLPNPNSGTDAVTMRDDRQALVYNHSSSRRSPLNLALSRDGITWEGALILEDGEGEFSYPAIIQTTDGLLHISCTWKRERIRHYVVDPGKLVLRPLSAWHNPDGQ